MGRRRDRRAEQGRRGAHPDLHRRDSYLIWRVSKDIQLAAREALIEATLTWDQFLVLTVLTRLKEARQILLVERTGLDRMRVARAVTDLEFHDVVVRRGRIIAITAEGDECVADAALALDRVEADYFGALGADERARLHAALAGLVPRLRHALTGLDL